MRNQRGRQLDWSKPFKLICSKNEFDSLQATDLDAGTRPLHQQPKKQPHQDKKQQIVIPKIEVVIRATKVKSFAGVPLEYIRLPRQLNLPNASRYELTEVDHIFVHANEGRFKFAGRNILDTELLEKAFVELELKARRAVIPRAKTWILDFLEKEYKQLATMEKYDQFADLIYNYWRNRREQLKFPLLRLLWRPNHDEYNQLMAFKLRDKDKRNLRRPNRVSDQQIGVQLSQEFEDAFKIAERLKMRQELKLKAVKLSIMGFHSECKMFKDKGKDKQVIGFFEECKKDGWYEGRGKDRENIKSFQVGLEAAKERRDRNDEYDFQDQNADVVYDPKLSAANFVASVVSYADHYGVTYESIFHNKEQHYREDSNTITSSFPLQRETIRPTFHVDLRPAVDKEQHHNFDRSESPNMDLSICNDYLIRSFSTPQTQSRSRSKPAYHSNFLDYKRSKASDWYFGDDDAGDFKDLRKTIAANFKRFQQSIKQE